MLRVNLLGAPEIYLDDPPNLRFRTRKAQALLIYLAVTERRWTRDSLATLFWPETGDATARKNLRDILPSLRRQVGEYLLPDDDLIGLNPASPTKCDVTHFSRVLEQPLQKVETETLAATLSLYRGEFLEGYTGEGISADFELWALRERERLHQLALMGFTTLCRRQQEEGAYEAALVTIRQLLKLAPWDEAAHRQQMLLLAQSGQRAAALAHFESCRQLLADELDVEPDEETVQLYEQIKAGRVVAQPAPAMEPPPPPAAKAPTIPHNLPRQLSSLIGREADINTLQHLLCDENTALITLVGQGGVGKTRLALAIAQQLRQRAPRLFPDGIWFMSLAGIAAGENASEQVAGAIAQAMGLSLIGSDPLSRQILRALQEQQLLLVLDNFEHLVAEQAFLLEVVQTAQKVKLLVTSREQLRLHAEHLYPVVGLPVPTADEVDAAEEPVRLTALAPAQQSRSQQPVNLGQYAGVQLFVARVQQRLPEFQLTSQNQNNIGRVCRLLGGVPLGIELAAQLYVQQGVTVLTQLIAEIEQLDPLERPALGATHGLDHLQTLAIDLPPRHRSIHAVFLHSWQLLTATEQDLLRHCAIFRGGFTREAILTVGASDGATLLSLVTKSLVQRDSHDRYDLHELVRQYIIEQFQQEPMVVHAAAQKHAVYFTDLLAGQEEKLLREPDFHQLLQIEIFNIRAAWQWFFNQTVMEQAHIAQLERCVTCLFQFFFLTSQRQEALALAQQAIVSLRQQAESLESSQLTQRLLGQLLVNAAEAGVRMQQRDVVKRWVGEAGQIAEALADAALMSQVYLVLAVLDASGPNYDKEIFDVALTWAKRAARPFLAAQVLLTAISHWSQPRFAPAKSQAACQELMQLIESQGYRYLVGDALVRQGMVYRAAEEWGDAIESTHQGLEACQNHYGSTYTIRMAHELLGQIYIQLRNFHEAERWALAAYQQSKIHGNQLSVLHNLYHLGIARINLEDWSAAEGYLHELVTTAERLEATHYTILGYIGLGLLHNRQARYNEARVYYQKALQFASPANYPANWAVTVGGLATTYLRQAQIQEAYDTLQPVLADDTLFSFNNRTSLSLAAITYEVLTARHDPQAERILDKAYSILQIELAKFKTHSQQSDYERYREFHQNIITWWQAKQEGSTSTCS